MFKPDAKRVKYLYLPLTVAYICIALFFFAIAQIIQGKLSITSTAKHNSADPIDISAVASHDHNSNGNPDAQDIVNAARAYIQTKPIYFSFYYEGGWPTDNRGVCTDLVAAGLLGAGYNLKDLIDEDIALDPSAYSLHVPDPNIDYRRVSNIFIYLERHAESLPTDTVNNESLASFLPGDIVVFSNHIALVSDIRAKSGKPYLLHHISPWQLQYEEDYLSVNTEVIGHFRLRP